MIISYSQLPAFVSVLQDASRDENAWMGFESRIQQLSTDDLHFFSTENRAADFVHYLGLQGRNIILLPVEATRYFLHEAAREKLQDGIPAPNISLDAAGIHAIHQEMVFNSTATILEELTDEFNWSKVFYDPLEANTEAESVEDKIAFIRLEFLVEQLSGFSQRGERANAFVRTLVERHWAGQPMAVRIEEVLNGRYVTTNFFNHLNTNVMNDKNLEFLKGNIKFTGFGETLFDELEKNIREGRPAFQLHFTTQIHNRPFDAVLDFKKGSKDDMYFYNGYRATLERKDGVKLEQYFDVEKGKGVTGKEAYNLLQGRAVVDRGKIDHLDKDAREALTVKPWIQLDFEKSTQQGFGYKEFSEGFGYNVREAVAKFDIVEMDGTNQESDLIKSLEKGNMQAATVKVGGEDKQIYLAANPQYKTVNVYDNHFKMMKHEELPLKQGVGMAQGAGESVGQSAKQDVKQETSQSVNKEQKQTPQNHSQKNSKAHLNKNRVSDKKGLKI